MGDIPATTAKSDLTGKVAVITGAARGIGLALALHAADQGMKVALADDDQDLLAAAVEQVHAQDGGAVGIHTDMLDYNAVRQLARRTEAELGSPWLLCNSSATRIDVNLWGVIHGVQVFVPDMVRRGNGHIINITSADLLGTRGAACSVATHHAIRGLSESLYRELDSQGSKVGVTLVCPPLVNTSLAGATQHENSDRNLGCDPPEDVLPPAHFAEQIFAAMARRCFWVFPHEPHVRETSCRQSDSAAGPRIQSSISRSYNSTAASMRDRRQCSLV